MKRAMEIADHANNTTGVLGDGVEFLRGLDETERQRECYSLISWVLQLMLIPMEVFRAVHDSAKEMRVWAGEAKKT